MYYIHYLKPLSYDLKLKTMIVLYRNFTDTNKWNLGYFISMTQFFSMTHHVKCSFLNFVSLKI